MNEELQTLEAALAELDAEFAEMAFDEESLSMPELQEFEAWATTTKLTSVVPVDSHHLVEEEFLGIPGIGYWIKNKAKKILSKLIKIAQRVATRCPDAPAAVAQVVSLFKAGNYLSAIKAGYNAYKTIKRCAA